MRIASIWFKAKGKRELVGKTVYFRINKENSVDILDALDNEAYHDLHFDDVCKVVAPLHNEERRWVKPPGQDLLSVLFAGATRKCLHGSRQH